MYNCLLWGEATTHSPGKLFLSVWRFSVREIISANCNISIFKTSIRDELTCLYVLILCADNEVWDCLAESPLFVCFAFENINVMYVGGEKKE